MTKVIELASIGLGIGFELGSAEIVERLQDGEFSLTVFRLDDRKGLFTTPKEIRGKRKLLLCVTGRMWVMSHKGSHRVDEYTLPLSGIDTIMQEKVILYDADPGYNITMIAASSLCTGFLLVSTRDQPIASPVCYEAEMVATLPDSTDSS